MGNLSRDLTIGLLAGTLAGAALLGMSQIMYDLTSPKEIDKENALSRVIRLSSSRSKYRLKPGRK